MSHPGSTRRPAARRPCARRGSQDLHRLPRPNEARGLHRLRQQASVGHPLHPLHAQVRARGRARPHEEHSRNGLPQEQDAQGHLEGGDPQARGGRARLPVVGALGMGDEGQAVSSEAFPRRHQGCCPRCRSGARRESAADRIRLRARNTPGVRRAHSVRSAGRASGRIL